VENNLVDLQAADVSDLRWEELVEEMTGPDNFVNQCTSCATCYGPCFYSGQNCAASHAPVEQAEPVRG
jgi:hypothetical protein